jgi:hypothetical protein
MISVERVFREKRSLMLPLLLVLAANVVLLVLAVLPLMRSVASEETRAGEAARERAGATRALERAEAIVGGKARADSELTRFYTQVLPPDQTGARRITYLNLQQLAEQAGIDLAGQETAITAPDPDSTLTKFTTRLTLRGSYGGIREFIHAIEGQPAFLVIEHMALSVAAAADEPLQVEVTVSTYYKGPDGL